MNIKIRRFIALIFIVGFLVAAPILILYTAGYRYSWKKQEISKAGSLVLETEPRGADVYLNNAKLESTTPIRLTEVFPNDYKILIEKDGYYSWQKTLPVTAQNTTFAEDIILFKKSSEQQIENLNLPNIIELNNGQIFYEITSEENLQQIYCYNLSEEKNTLIYEYDSSVFSLKNIWPDFSNNYVLLNLQEKNPKKKFIVVNIKNPNQQFVLNQELKNSNFQQIRWDLQQDNVFYYFNGSQIYRARIKETQITNELIKEFELTQKISDFIIFNDGLFYLENFNQKLFLKKTSLNEEQSQTVNDQIQLANANYKFIDIIDNKLLLQNTDQNTMYFINLEINNVLLELQNFNQYKYDVKNNRLLAFNNSEILTIDMTSSLLNPQTVWRVSQGISDAGWYTNPNYIYAVKDGRINLIELDERDITNIHELSPENVNQVYLQDSGEFIYFTKHGSDYLYSIQITD